MLQNPAMIDKLLGGRYRIITTLGSGGFSQTYIAEDTHRPGNPKCAVKHLQPVNSNQSFLQSARRLFNFEAETLEKLGHHDRIPRLLAYFEENQEFYLVQEFIEGQLLTDKLPPNHRWAENQVWEFVKEILEILVFIHAQGFIHRDIKPSNIIQRQQDNKLVLVDFGAVKQNWTELLSLTANIEMPATVGIGTPGYMPMEQARGRPRPNSDIYALGAIAVQALTGLYPMQLEEDFETGELLWQQSAQVSDALAVIITKMVRYHFKDRYESAADALAEIQQLAPLYLPTEIGIEPVNLPLSTQNTASATGITTPIFPVSTKASCNFPTLLSNTSVVVPSTTIVSPSKPQRPSSHRRPYYLALGATLGAVLVAVGAGYSTYWQPRLQFEQTLAQSEKLKATGKYSECMVRLGTIPQSSSLYAEAQNILHECKLTEAKRLAANADFKGAIALVSSLAKDTQAYREAKTLINQWSNSILASASSKYQAGKLDDAIAMAQNIPSTSLVYPKAQATIKQWQSPTTKNNSYSAATVKFASPKPAAVVANKKVVMRKSAANQPRSYSPSTKKVVVKSVASKPRSYSPPTKKVVVKKSVASKPVTTTRKPRSYSKASYSTKRIPKTSRVATNTRSKRTSSNKKYLNISKKVSSSSYVKTRTKKVIKRVTTKMKRSYSQKQSYRWTTKTVR